MTRSFVFTLAFIFLVVHGAFQTHPSLQRVAGAEVSTRLTTSMDFVMVTSTGSGILQIKVDDEWKTVSAEGFSDEALSTACFALGYSLDETYTWAPVRANSNLWETNHYVELYCSRWSVTTGVEDCRAKHAVDNSNLRAASISCSQDFLPERKALEKITGKCVVYGNEALMVAEGINFKLVGPTRKDLDELEYNVLNKWVLFEGYRRGSWFEAVGWTYFPQGDPFREHVEQPAIIEGERTAMVARLIMNGRVPDATQEQIYSEVFGQNSDEWNINLFEKCSYGSYKIVPFKGSYAGKVETAGVIDLNLGNVHETDAEKVGTLAAAHLPYDDSVDFILFVLPDGFVWRSEDTAAAATLAGRFSIYRNLKILNPFVVGHEIGHNLGLKHSADVSDPETDYGDHTCIMGNGYGPSDGRRDFDENTHCFNAPKNWQLGWYADRRAQWSPSDGLKTFDLVGLGDYALSNNKQTIVLEVEESPADKYYISFNRKSGVHSDIKEYEDLVTIHSVRDDGISDIISKFGSGDWYALDTWAIHVHTIDIRPDGQPSVAQMTLGPKSDIIQFNAAKNRPMNCIVDSKKSAPLCTEQCGTVTAVSEVDFPAYFGGSCEYECGMYDGLCVVGGRCTTAATQKFQDETKDVEWKSQEFFCEFWTSVPEEILSDFTCYADKNPYGMMVSDYHPFCSHDFSSKAKIADQKEFKFTLTYEIEGTSKPEHYESSTQFSNTTIFEQSISELLGEYSVEVQIDPSSDTVEVTVTNYHEDLEERLKHEWFLMRLQERLEYDQVYAKFVDLQLEDDDGNVLDDIKEFFVEDAKGFFEDIPLLYLIGIGAGSFLFCFAISLWCWCGSSKRKKVIQLPKGVAVIDV